MIKYIFSEPAFLNLCDNEGQLVGNKTQKIIKQLQENFCEDEETEEETLKQYKKMNIKYDPDDMVQVYFKALHDARTILMYLQETVTDRLLLSQYIFQFNKHMNLNEAVEEWEKSRLRKYGRNPECTSSRQ